MPQLDLVRADGQGDSCAGHQTGGADAQADAPARHDIGAEGHAIHHVGLADELGHEARAGLVEQLVRRPHLSHPPGLDDGDAIGDHHRLGLVVRHVEGRDAELLVEPPDLEAHLLPEVRVQVGERLVEQEDLGLDDQGARHRHPLLLPPAQLAR
jgi:hypothetical protein